MDNKHYDLSDYPTDQQAVGGRVEPVVMCTDDIAASLAVPAHLFGKNNQIFVDMPNLPEHNELCDIVFEDGSKGEGKLSIARGWFKPDGQPFTNKSPIAKWRYKYT